MPLNDYTHTGAPTVSDLRAGFYKDFNSGTIDAPDFLPLGFHFSLGRKSGAIAAHNIRPGTFASTKQHQPG